jgi:hypothetical protein
MKRKTAMAQETYTENLADFGRRERYMLRELLSHPLPKGFDGTRVKAAFNRNSGNVFLVNEDRQCAMMNGNGLELFHSTPYQGHEGFLSDLVDEHAPDDLHAEDVEYIRDAAKNEGFELTGKWAESEAT